MEKVNQILMQKYPFAAFELSLPSDACSPVISKDTIVHHYEYFKNYVDELNIIFSQFEECQKLNLMDIFMEHEKIDKRIRAKVLELAGGIFNHEFLFYLMAPPIGLEPSGNLLDKINKDFGSYEKLKEKIKEVACESFGSRYVGLVLDEFNDLKVLTLEKESTPYVFSLKPLYLLDLFEHAYYLDEKENVGKYIDKSFKCIDFVKIEEMFNEYMKIKK